ncbi:MAG: DinB family protein [Phycisphaerales bacterium]
MDRITQLLDAYASGPAEFERCVQNLPAELIDYVPGAAPGKWSVRRIVAHVAETEMVYYGRMRKAAAEPGSTIWAFDQDAWAAKLGDDAIDVDQCLAVIAAVRAMAEPWLRRLPIGAWSQTVHHPEAGEMTLETVLTRATRHITAHIAQIGRNVEAHAKQ